MHKIVTPRPVPAAFGVFWNSSFGPVPCEAYTIDANGNTTSGDDATAAFLAGAYASGAAFLTYEAYVSEETANGRAIECGRRYSARPLPAGWYFYIGEQPCVVAPAEPAKIEATRAAPTALDLAEQVAVMALDFIKAVCDDARDWDQTAHKLNDQIHAFRTAAQAETKAARQ